MSDTAHFFWSSSSTFSSMAECRVLIERNMKLDQLFNKKIYSDHYFEPDTEVCSSWFPSAAFSKVGGDSSSMDLEELNKYTKTLKKVREYYFENDSGLFNSIADSRTEICSGVGAPIRDCSSSV